MIITAIVVSLVLGVLILATYLSRAALERFLYYFAGFFIGSDIQSRVWLGNPVSADTWQTVDGDLVSYLKIRGSRRLIGKEDFNKLTEKLTKELTTLFRDGSGKQYSLSVGFLSDPPGTGSVIRETLRPGLATAARMGMGAKARVWFDSKLENLTLKCNEEV